MRFDLKKLHPIAMAALVPLCAAASKAWADQNPGDYLHNRTYIGLIGTSINVSNKGEFTGLNYARSDTPYEIILIPSIAQNFGFGLLAGHREEAYAMELSYQQSGHTASFGPAALGSVSGSSAVFSSTVQDAALYHSVNVDFKRYFLTELPVQPFISLGVSFPWIVVSNASSDGSGNIGAATFAGLGLNLGIGAEYYLTPNVSFVGGVCQRWASFDQFKGFGSQYANLAQYGSPSSNEGSGLNFTIGTTLGFQ